MIPETIVRASLVWRIRNRLANWITPVSRIPAPDTGALQVHFHCNEYEARLMAQRMQTMAVTAERLGARWPSDSVTQIEMIFRFDDGQELQSTLQRRERP